MRISILPKRALGWWSVALAILFILFLSSPILSRLMLPLLRALHPRFPVQSVVVFLSGIAALVTGIISIIKFRERAILVFLATLVGLFALLFLLGEFLFPH